MALNRSVTLAKNECKVTPKRRKCQVFIVYPGTTQRLPLTIRRARAKDARAVYDALAEVAPKIPLRLSEKVRELVDRLCASRRSLVAQHGDKIIGFLLAEPGQRNTAADPPVLDLPYGGVSAHARRSGVMRALINAMKTRGVALTATVHHGNQSSMADILGRFGFVPIPRHELNTLPQDYFRWEPPVRRENAC